MWGEKEKDVIKSELFGFQNIIVTAFHWWRSLRLDLFFHKLECLHFQHCPCQRKAFNVSENWVHSVHMNRQSGPGSQRNGSPLCFPQCTSCSPSSCYHQQGTLLTASPFCTNFTGRVFVTVTAPSSLLWWCVRAKSIKIVEWSRTGLNRLVLKTSESSLEGIQFHQQFSEWYFLLADRFACMLKKTGFYLN